MGCEEGVEVELEEVDGGAATRDPWPLWAGVGVGVWGGAVWGGVVWRVVSRRLCASTLCTPRGLAGVGPGLPGGVSLDAVLAAGRWASPTSPWPRHCGDAGRAARAGYALPLVSGVWSAPSPTRWPATSCCRGGGSRGEGWGLVGRCTRRVTTGYTSRHQREEEEPTSRRC